MRRTALLDDADGGQHGSSGSLKQVILALAERRVPDPRRRYTVKPPETTQTIETQPPIKDRPSHVNRRAFLRGAGGVAIGLPFLEGLPERSAWAADAPPVFSLSHRRGVRRRRQQVLPDRHRRAVDRGLGGATDKATSVLRRTPQTCCSSKKINFPLGGRRAAVTRRGSASR